MGWQTHTHSCPQRRCWSYALRERKRDRAGGETGLSAKLLLEMKKGILQLPEREEFAKSAKSARVGRSYFPCFGAFNMFIPRKQEMIS